MCNCLSFLVSRTGQVFYISKEQEQDYNNKVKKSRPDSHSGIAEYYDIDEDKMNKYEYNLFSKVLKEDSIVFDYDIKKVERIAKKIAPKRTTKYWKLRVVKQRGWSIQYINNPDKDVQLEAVKQDGYSIQCIHYPDKDAIEYCRKKGIL